MKKNGFSTIIAILITAFLVVISSGVLGIVLQESKNTRLVYDSISTSAGAEGAIEYALLKIKNHKDGFQDKVKDGQDYDSSLLSSDPSNPSSKDQKIEYEILDSAATYSGIVQSGEFEIIPLFSDLGEMMQYNSKKVVSAGNIKKSTDLNLKGDNEFVWNIVGNSTTGETFGIVGTGSAGNMITKNDQGAIRKVEDDSNNITGSQKIISDEMKISDFLNAYESNYLIIYNPTKDEMKYVLSSDKPFSLPKLQIVGSSRIGNHKQNLIFEENKSRYFDALKYSVYNKN